MKWIGLTGGLGTGKSTVSKWLKQKGIPVVDADELAREVVKPGRPALIDVELAFGPEFLTQEGTLDRERMAQHVFAHPEELSKLEKILHPRIFEEAEKIRKSLDRAGHPFAIYDIPLLFEKNLSSRFDLVVVVKATGEQQVERVKKRSGWSDLEIAKRLKAQVPIREKIKQADYVIDNTQDDEHLKNEVEKFLNWLSGQSRP